MAAGYVNQRQRLLLGGSRLVPRRRRLLGDDADFFAGALATPLPAPSTPTVVVAPDFGVPSSVSTASIFAGPAVAESPSLPSSFFAPSKPIIPAPVAQPAIVAPDLGKPAGLPSVLPQFQVVFPSQGAVARAIAPPSWLDQQIIAGIPNSYLAIGAAAIAGIALLRSSSRRRR